MKLLIAFGTDDGENLNNDHVGMAKYYYFYEFSNGKEKFVERRENVHFKGIETIHGDPEKAKATSSAIEGADVLVGKKFGPNLLILLRRFVCVVAKTHTIGNAIELVHNNMDKILAEKNKTEDRKHIVLS
jgi:predicted Fe-Mo cluster-binding NifX family protein